MQLTESRTLTKIGGVDLEVPDDLFIGSVSFESRCTACVQRLSDSYKCGHALLIRFKNAEQGIRDTYSNEMGPALAWHMTTPRLPDVLWCDKDDAMDGHFKLLQYLQSLGSRPKTLTLDATTLTKQYLLVLLRTLRGQLPDAAFRVLYTPATYSFSHGRARMTYGVKYVTPVPFFAGIQQPERRDLLVLFLGYEGERAVRIWRSVEPERTIAIITNPALRPGGHLPAITNNKTLLEMEESVVEQRQIPAGSPDAVYELLRGVHESYPDWNIVVASLGPKVQTLGIYLFFESHPQIGSQILYAPAATYDEKHYTVAAEPYTMEYRLQLPSEVPKLGMASPEWAKPDN